MMSTANDDLKFNQTTVDAVDESCAGDESRTKAFDEFMARSKTPEGIRAHKMWLKLHRDDHGSHDDSGDWTPPPNKIPSPTSDGYESKNTKTDILS